MMPVSAGHQNRRCLSRQLDTGPGRRAPLTCRREIEDEDSTLAERQEARAERRFTGYSGKRASESAQALDEVERLAMIPPGQPILVGHHSERRARRDAQR